MHEPFALLLAVYDGDRPDHVRRALRSAVDEQTVRPDQVIIVRDGPVRGELADCLDEITARCPVPVTFVRLEHNSGLGPALDQGLAASKFDIIARMDADDIALPRRFEVQLPLLADADIVGAGLLEFVGDTDHIVGQRVPPLSPPHIARYARMHDPFNHPTVVYRRRAVLAAGGYGDLPLMEDYALFARMIQTGARTANVADPLIYYRVGESAFKRRGGAALLRSELRLQREFRRTGFTSVSEYLRNVVVRGGYRLIPWWLRRAVYRPLVAVFGRNRDRAAVARHTGTPERPDSPEQPETSQRPGSPQRPETAGRRPGSPDLTVEREWPQQDLPSADLRHDPAGR